MAKKEDTKAVTKKDPQVPAERQVGGPPMVGTEVDGAWGGEDISSQDIIIPKILLMQPMSDLVTDGIAKIGEFRDSLNKDVVLGSDKEAVEFIVFGTFKNYLEFKDDEYLRTVQGDMGDLPQEEILEDGAAMKRTRVQNAYVLLTRDIKNGEPFPYVISFKSTGYTAGKTLMTYIKKLQLFKKPSAAKVFALTCTKETNEKGTFFVPQISTLRDSTTEEMSQSYEWYKLLAKSKVRVDDSDVNKDSTGDAVTSATREATSEASAH
jgi:hypothetical protein